MKHFTHLIYLLLALFAMPVAPANGGNGMSLQEQELPFAVKSRKHRFEFAPCSECHIGVEIRPEVLELMTSLHIMEARHGIAGLRCSICHRLDKGGDLHMLSGEAVDLDSSFYVCAQCHISVYRDWKHGAHGKRLNSWRGERVILNCTECHNPHIEMGIKPRPPMKPPGVRQRQQHQERRRGPGNRPWERTE